VNGHEHRAQQPAVHLRARLLAGFVANVGTDRAAVWESLRWLIGEQPDAWVIAARLQTLDDDAWDELMERCCTCWSHSKTWEV
jgi:hypothetical protein